MRIGLIYNSSNPNTNSVLKKLSGDTFITLGLDNDGRYCEVYTGKNYLPNSTKRSYSRIYRGCNLQLLIEAAPIKYANYLREMYKFHTNKAN